jgi:hypothetical protein
VTARGRRDVCPSCRSRLHHAEGCRLTGLSVSLAARSHDLLAALGEARPSCPRCLEAAVHVTGCALAALTIVQAWATGPHA